MNLIDRVLFGIQFLIEMIKDIINNNLRFIGMGPKKFKNFPKTLKGKVVIITGANTGIGKATATVLAKLNARVIMACRDITKAHNAAQGIKQEFKEANVVIRKLDLSSLTSIRQFARMINQEEDRIDYLINNAGIMYCPKLQTEDGFEMQFGTNHLGHFLLTNLLIGKLKNSNARVINVSSVAHITGEINWDDINLDKNYNKYDAYSQSKLANILFTRELAKRVSHTEVKVYCLHPGLIRTDLYRHMEGIVSLIIKIFIQINAIGPELGAQTILFCTLEESINGETGNYYKNCHRVDDMMPNAVNDVWARKLWELSCDLLEIENKHKL